MRVSKYIELDYGHTLPNHYGFCSQVHGHRARVTVVLEGEMLVDPSSSSCGMVIDFGFIKHALMERVHAVLDHGFAVWAQDTDTLPFITKRNSKVLILPTPPTAEALAVWAYEALLPVIPDWCKLVSVTWHETPSSAAEYSGPKLS